LKEKFITKLWSCNILKDEVEKALKEIQPHLRADGGDIELVDIDEEGNVKVKLTGACAGCPMSQMTLQLGVERFLKKKVPRIKSVIRA
jgi:Fe-S cluster biogenesis protein NfuA